MTSGPAEKRPSKGPGTRSQLVASKGNNWASLLPSLTLDFLVCKMESEDRPTPALSHWTALRREDQGLAQWWEGIRCSELG